jgi:ABC-type methionine transport system permease subunit
MRVGYERKLWNTDASRIYMAVILHCSGMSGKKKVGAGGVLGDLRKRKGYTRSQR